MVIIAAVEGHSDWVNSLVIRGKPNGRLRVCLDQIDLNKAIKREHHPNPTLDDITPRLHGSYPVLQTRCPTWLTEHKVR